MCTKHGNRWCFIKNSNTEVQSCTQLSAGTEIQVSVWIIHRQASHRAREIIPTNRSTQCLIVDTIRSINNKYKFKNHILRQWNYAVRKVPGNWNNSFRVYTGLVPKSKKQWKTTFHQRKPTSNYTRKVAPKGLWMVQLV